MRGARKCASASNRANQLNPNNHAYYRSRGVPSPPSSERQRSAQRTAAARKNAGHFEHRANNLVPKAKAPQDVKVLEAAVREVVGGQAHLRKVGSRKKGTAIHGSDHDYHLRTAPKLRQETRITKKERDSIITTCSKADAKASAGKAAIKVEAGKESIDVFAPKAEWHDRPTQQPQAYQKSAKSAIRKIKKWAKENDILEPSYQLEDRVQRIGREKGWNDQSDPSGIKRFSEAQRQLREEGDRN